MKKIFLLTFFLPSDFYNNEKLHQHTGAYDIDNSFVRNKVFGKVFRK